MGGMSGTRKPHAFYFPEVRTCAPAEIPERSRNPGDLGGLENFTTCFTDVHYEYDKGTTHDPGTVDTAVSPFCM